MTKQKRWIPLCILGLLIVLLLAGAAVLGAVYAQGGGITVGQYLELPDHKAHFLIDGNSLIRLSGDDALFDSLNTGDTIALVHGAVKESYPAQTDAYRCVRLSESTGEGVPLEILQTLSQLGYFDDGQDLPGTVPFEAQYIHSSVDLGESTYPAVRIIRSVSELHAYYDTVYPSGYNGVMFDHSTTLLEAFNAYDDAYFEDHILLLVLLQEGSGSIRHEVTSVSKIQDGLLVSVDSNRPEVLTWDMAWWHIIIEPEAGVDVPDESHVTVSTTERRSTWPTTVCSYPTVAHAE